jgi:hypothetical protein
MYFKEIFQNLGNEFDEKQTKKLQLESIMSLSSKLEEKSIEDNDMDLALNEISDLLQEYKSWNKEQLKQYFRKVAAIKKEALEKHKLVEKGYYANTYLALGISIGVVLGAALMTTIGTAHMGTGLALGLTLGLALGAMADKKAADSGRQY